MNFAELETTNIPFDISLDPGLSKTGICVWRDGVPMKIGTGTLRPSQKTVGYLEKLKELALDLELILWDLGTYFRADPELPALPIHRVVIEDFNRYQSNRDKDSFMKAGMMMCCGVQGMLFGVCRNKCVSVDFISKNRIQKSQTAILAEAYGLKGSKDFLDAFQIGVCAGLDRKHFP